MIRLLWSSFLRFRQAMHEVLHGLRYTEMTIYVGIIPCEYRQPDSAPSVLRQCRLHRCAECPARNANDPASNHTCPAWFVHGCRSACNSSSGSARWCFPRPWEARPVLTHTPSLLLSTSRPKLLAS